MCLIKFKYVLLRAYSNIFFYKNKRFCEINFFILLHNLILHLRLYYNRYESVCNNASVTMLNNSSRVALVLRSQSFVYLRADDRS